MARKRSKKKNKDSEQLTPYQGPFRTFGEFHCLECNRYWMSANSWANTAQKCQSCNTWIYPFRQSPLLRGKKKDKLDPKKAHQQAGCQKCIKLGKSCVRIHVDNSRKNESN